MPDDRDEERRHLRLEKSDARDETEPRPIRERPPIVTIDPATLRGYSEMRAIGLRVTQAAEPGGGHGWVGWVATCDAFPGLEGLGDMPDYAIGSLLSKVIDRYHALENERG
jgi:hypothetical protein